MPMKLLVVIPTWNRADYLDKAISAISAARSRARNCHVELFVSDNCSSDHTSDVMARWQEIGPWIHYLRWEEHTGDWAEILRRAFLSSQLEYDYLWLQGDDDYVCDTTAYIQLQEALMTYTENPPALVHCCQARRSLPGDRRVLEGNTEDLCNTYGWHDLLGWVSSLVISKGTVGRMMASPQWETPAPSAFIHSEALLEAAYGRTMLILTAGLIDPQDEQQTAESLQRWAEANVGERYWRIIPGLLNLRQRGVLTTPMTLGFFRYLTGTFWDRFATEVMSRASMPDTPEEELRNKLRLLSFFSVMTASGQDQKLYEDWFDGFQDDVWEVRRAIHLIQKRIEGSTRPSRSFSLLTPPSVSSPTPAKNAIHPESTLNCKCCGSISSYLGYLDFNKSCSDRNGRVLPLSEERVPYYGCPNCGFVFTNYCDKWSSNDFKELIYNKEYSRVDFDPNIADGIEATISYKNGKALASYLDGGQGKLRLLDFGAGGNPGTMGHALIDSGFDVTSFEPYFSDTADTLKLSGKYDVIYAIEVFEHCHDLPAVLKIIDKYLSNNGILYFSTLLHPFPPTGNVLDSWYIAPRNGHVSIFTEQAITTLFKQIGINIMHHTLGWIGFKNPPNFHNAFFIDHD